MDIFMIPHSVRNCKGQAVLLMFGGLSKKGGIMDIGTVIADKPPSSGAEQASFPSRVFGYGTTLYHEFLEALLDGLRAYDAIQGGVDDGPSPLPAAQRWADA